MKYIDYVQLNPFQKFWYNFKNAMIALPSNIGKVFKAIGRFFKKIFVGIGKGFAGYFTRFVKGDWATKLSYIIMGFGNIVRGQIGKGIIFLATEIAFILFMVTGLGQVGLGWSGIYNLGFFNNGKIGFHEKAYWAVDEVTGRRVHMPADNSMKLLLYGVMTLVIIALFIVIYVAATKSAYKIQQMKAAGEKPQSFKEDISALLDEKFHVTLLAFPTLTISIFTILPLIFMILIAFTNYDQSHNFFQWVGFETFGQIFATTGASALKGKTFLELTKWTLVWAVFATVLNYILGMVVALMINKKGIKLKALWRTLFVVTVAVPQFVSLLLMSQMLDFNNGAINLVLQHLGIIKEPINFLGDLSHPWIARITVIVVNIWVGIPYTILITSGILMNIPADLYESATIDGAGPVRSFVSITLPYMLFVTTPYLITTFIGNINNFNVIYLLCGSAQQSNELYRAGYTDLLVTWLFNLTTVSGDYNLAAAIGIMVFIVCATVSLLTFNLTKSAKNEEEFS